MSIAKKLELAKMTERGRVLWLIADEREGLRAQLEKVVLVEADRHVMQIKVRMAVAIYEALKLRIISGDEPPERARSDVLEKARLERLHHPDRNA